MFILLFIAKQIIALRSILSNMTLLFMLFNAYSHKSKACDEILQYTVYFTRKTNYYFTGLIVGTKWLLVEYSLRQSTASEQINSFKPRTRV